MSDTAAETTETKTRKPKTAFELEVSIAKRCKAALDTLPRSGQLSVLAMIQRHIEDQAAVVPGPAQA